MSKQVILTGLRTNAEYHLGNYLGAILPMVELQKKHLGEFQVNMFAPDLHSFTTPIDHSRLYEQTMHNLKVFVAAGMPLGNPDFYLYRQSHVSAHSELTIILNNFTGLGELLRMTQFKEKASAKRSELSRAIENLSEALAEANKKGKEEGTIVASPAEQLSKFERILQEEGKQTIAEELGHIRSRFTKEMSSLLKITKDLYEEVQELRLTGDASQGLLDYPVLMASDILLYSASYIPVGDDQRQHIELTRDLAERFNNKFGEVFVVPEPWDAQLRFAGRDEGIRIRSLKHPEKKMSKSIDDPSGTIALTDSPEEAAKKVRGATTDALGQINWDWNEQPGVTNLLQMSYLLGDESREAVIERWQGKESYGELKSAVAEQVARFLENLHGNIAAVSDESLATALERDEQRMSEQANQTLHAVQRAVGLRPSA